MTVNERLEDGDLVGLPFGILRERQADGEEPPGRAYLVVALPHVHPVR